MAEAARGDGLRLALTTLSVLPVRGPGRLDRRTAGTAMSLAPLVGVLLWCVLGPVLSGLVAVAPRASAPLSAATLTIALLAALTRGLHLDGLADTADGLASYRPPEQARAVMKTPEVGALGVVTVVLVLAVQVAALLACVEAGRGARSLLLALVTSRVAVACACTPATAAATPTGLGALVAGTVRPGVAVALALVAAVGGTVVGGLGSGGPGSGAVRALVAVSAGLLAARLLRRHAGRRFGGLTGDVLGALVEVCTAVVLIVMSVEAPR